MSEPRRATSCAEAIELTVRGINPEIMAPVMAMKARATDVFLAAFPKSGITWTQHIAHGLRSRGDMSFEEISDVAPWIEMAMARQLDLADDQVAEPRLFKTHLTYEMTPKDARYIYILRDPKDCLVSYYHYYNGWIIEQDSVDIDDFAREFFMPASNPLGRIWEHFLSWVPHHGRDDILFLCFEDMKKDLSGTVARIAGFLGIELDDELRQVVEHQSSSGFMKQHGEKFDEHILMPLIEQNLNLPPGAAPVKVREGRVGDHRQEVSAEVLAEIEAIWQDTLAGPLGAASYDELRARLAPR